MFMTVTFITLLIKIPSGDSIFRTCVPNTQFLLNGHLCNCNSMGRWSEAKCQMIGRRQTCQPGQIIWEECSQCICQDNGKLLCSNTECAEEGTKQNVTSLQAISELWCTPFRSYYINCSLCVCPASGKMSEARCATDSSCSLKGPNISLDVIQHNVCIPKVMYLFNCLHCLCSDDGFFVQNKCVETCHKVPDSTKRCIPRTFYRVDCNIYRCPENGVPDESIKSKSICNKQSNPLKSLVSLRNVTTACTPNKYTKPKCIYCECSSLGVINESSCLEQECLKIKDFNYDSVKSTCTPGELVPTCMECFCLRNGMTMEKYCTRVCSLQNKLIMLERVLKEVNTLIDIAAIKDTAGDEKCEPNSLFNDQGRYCLCPDNGNTNFKFCTSITEETGLKKTQRVLIDKASLIDYNVTCEPNTFIEFGCNTCFCTKEGKINQKWCTYDDCNAKNIIKRSHKHQISRIPAESLTTCVAGSITRNDCNFCICSPTGLVKDRACTNNTCTGINKIVGNEFTCEPSAYYTVDCNTCFCGSDGIKNVDKCTKDQCENNFLRTDTCTPGDLFSDDCNICVCPPNGDKRDKACTNRTCDETDTPWKKIFKLSQSLLGDQVTEDTTRTLQLCFPGEEFERGCQICVCPDLGIKDYATCSMLCEKNKLNQNTKIPRKIRRDSSEELFEQAFITSDENTGGGREDTDELTKGTNIGGTDRLEDVFDDPVIDTRRAGCLTINISDSDERVQCSPGSQYIIRCRICICPYMGSINYWCRPMEPERYCEKAFPNYNYVPMGRRTDNKTMNGTKIEYPIQITVPHNHTMYRCEKPGKLSDECFICECEKDNILVEEHCYKNENDACIDATPTFIKAGEYPIGFKKYKPDKLLDTGLL